MQVNLMLRCKTNSVWRRYPAAISNNGKLLPHYAMVPKKQGEKSRTVEERHEEGTYVLRTFKDRRTYYRALGSDHRQAWKAYVDAKNIRNVLVLADKHNLRADVGQIVPGYIPLHQDIPHSKYLDKLFEAKKEDGSDEAADHTR